MPIKIPSDLPAHDVLTREGVMVVSEETALRQDIRPLQIGLVNLMPKKVQTETQLARLIGATPLQVELTLIRMSEHRPKNTSDEHMEAFYKTFAEAKHQKFDGLIITGAPIELLDFQEVTYWDELTQIFDWTQTNAHSTFAICWGAQAMLNHFHGCRSTSWTKRHSGVSATRTWRHHPRFCADFLTSSSCPSADGPRCARTTWRTMAISKF